MTDSASHDEHHGDGEPGHGHLPGHVHEHVHGHVQLDEADWAAYAAQTELQGEVFMQFLTDTLEWVGELRGGDAPVVQRILDIGSGPGVATCELATAYPEARVTAVDSSPAMLDRATQRATRLGLQRRVDVRLAELPDGVEGLAGADLIWASMSLHHVGDEVAALCVLRELLGPHGLLAIAEMADPTQLLPADLEIGRPGFAARIAAAGAAWFADMRHGLKDSVESADLGSMLASAGFEVLGERVARQRLEAPLDDAARRVAQGELLRTRGQFGDRLDADDLDTLEILCDENDPRGVLHRADIFMASARQIVVARPVAVS